MALMARALSECVVFFFFLGLFLILVEHLKSLCCRFSLQKWGKYLLLIDYTDVLFIVILRVFSVSPKEQDASYIYFSN